MKYSNMHSGLFKIDKYSVNTVLKKLKMTFSMIITKIYNDSICNSLDMIEI